jgi:hypothetical protein
MTFDCSQLLIAGATDNSEYEEPDLVYVLFTDTPGAVPCDAFKRALWPSEVVIAGPRGADGKVDMLQAQLYQADGGSTASTGLSQIVARSFARQLKWAEQLETYRPFSDQSEYYADVRDRWGHLSAGRDQWTRIVPDTYGVPSPLLSQSLLVRSSRLP